MDISKLSYADKEQLAKILLGYHKTELRVKGDHSSIEVWIDEKGHLIGQMPDIELKLTFFEE